MGFHPKSRIIITSSSKAILEDLLPNINLYMPMPIVMVEEARALFFKHAISIKAISELAIEEQKILGICIQKCWFYSQEGGSYHPVSLTTLADFFSQLGRAKENQILVWKDHLEKEMDLVKDVLKLSKDLFGILGLQFSTFDFCEKLLFLDLALYSSDDDYSWEDSLYGDIGWLCWLHDESPTIIGRKLMDLQKSGMINFNLSKNMDYDMQYEFKVPPLNKEFAKWFAMDHNVNGLKNAWGVFQPAGMNLRGDSSTSIKCWSNLIRLRISSMTVANARFIASKRMQELNNIVVLQLLSCLNFTMLNLEGLDYLRELELVDLLNLMAITFSGNSSKDNYVDIYNSLQHVLLINLVSLVHMLDLRPCTSLHLVFVEDCTSVRNFEGADCPCVVDLTLCNVNPDHFERLIDFKSFQSLKKLQIDVDSSVDGFSGQWIQREATSDVGVWDTLEGEGPCAKLLKKLHLPLYRVNNLICTNFVPS